MSDVASAPGALHHLDESMFISFSRILSSLQG